MRYDFWGKGAAVARVFGTRVSLQTWHNLVCGVAREISMVVRARKVARWVDVGSGDGETCLEVMEAMNDLSPECQRLMLVTVECDPTARTLQSEILPDAEVGGRVVARLSDWRELSSEHGATVVTLLHSAYYLADSRQELAEVLRYLSEIITAEGALVLASLPCSSPMFQLGELGLYKTGRTEDILWAAEALGLTARVRQPGMKWLAMGLQCKGERDMAELDAVIRYVEGRHDLHVGDARRERFLKQVKKLASQGEYLDFQDNIVVISTNS